MWHRHYSIPMPTFVDLNVIISQSPRRLFIIISQSWCRLLSQLPVLSCAPTFTTPDSPLGPQFGQIEIFLVHELHLLKVSIYTRETQGCLPPVWAMTERKFDHFNLCQNYTNNKKSSFSLLVIWLFPLYTAECYWLNCKLELSFKLWSMVIKGILWWYMCKKRKSL